MNPPANATIISGGVSDATLPVRLSYRTGVKEGEMEDRTTIRERHGIANARKCSIASLENSDVQSVTVEDGRGEVLLRMQSSSYPAGLTPQQARMLAEELVSSAERVERTQA